MLFILPSTARADDFDPVRYIRKLINDALEETARQRRAFVAMAVAEEIVSGSILYATNFCSDYTSPKKADECLYSNGGDRKLFRVLSRYLTDATELRPTKIETIASRLAKLSGGNISAAGWPSEIENDLAVVDIPVELRGREISLQTSSGPRKIGWQTDHIIVKSGAAQFRISNGDAATVSNVTVLPRSRIPLSYPSQEAALKGAAGRVEVGEKHFCYIKRDWKFEGPMAAFNWGRAVFHESEQARFANLSPFTSQNSISIRVDDQSGGDCGSECKGALAASFAAAIAIWRSGCVRCEPNAFTVIKFDDTIWMDDRAVRALQQRATGTIRPLNLRDLNDGQRYISAPSAMVPQTLVVGYQDVTHEEVIKKQVCRAAASDAPWIRAAQGLFCAGAPAVSEALQPVLTLAVDWPQNDPTCPAEQKPLACGKFGGSITVFTFHPFKLRGPTGESVLEEVVGAVYYDLEQVIIHEVGHWFGVPHAERAGADAVLDVMAGVYGKANEQHASCVSAQSLMMLNNAADLRWQYRTNAGGALLPPQRKAPRPQR
jgi:hypothetical protein